MIGKDIKINNIHVFPLEDDENIYKINNILEAIE